MPSNNAGAAGPRRRKGRHRSPPRRQHVFHDDLADQRVGHPAQHAAEYEDLPRPSAPCRISIGLPARSRRRTTDGERDSDYLDRGQALSPEQKRRKQGDDTGFEATMTEARLAMMVCRPVRKKTL